MKNPTLIGKKNYLRAALMLPVACLLPFTGCSNIQGTSGNHTATNRVATYMEQSQEQTNNQPVDQDPDPGYEWFY